MAVVTVSRQYGSNGGEVARLLAEKLGYRLLDRDLVDAVAERAGVSVDVARTLDERGFGWADGLVHSLLLAFQGQQITQESYNYMACRLIREAAAGGDLVILGRAGQVVLGGKPRTFHVHIVAPLEARIAEIVRRERVTPEAARRLVQETDEYRRRYVWAIGGKDWSEPTLYDLVLNTHRIPTEVAADAIVAAARGAGILR